MNLIIQATLSYNNLCVYNIRMYFLSVPTTTSLYYDFYFIYIYIFRYLIIADYNYYNCKIKNKKIIINAFHILSEISPYIKLEL